MVAFSFLWSNHTLYPNNLSSGVHFNRALKIGMLYFWEKGYTSLPSSQAIEARIFIIWVPPISRKIFFP